MSRGLGGGEQGVRDLYIYSSVSTGGLGSNTKEGIEF